ncbi:MAG: site-specific DNA-methyltransferase [Chloroflexi bacterium]|nr:site-specific DNA-methyltransferase [Chloroflexota bacterium]
MSDKKKPQQESLVHEQAAAYEIAPRAKNGHRANALDGKTWTKYSISIWSDIKKTREEQELGHPAMFPLQLAQRLIECFTTEQDSLIVDPFAGVGTTVVAADRMNKTGIGVELSPKFTEIGLRRLGQRELFATKPRASEIYCDDANNLLKYVAPGTADLVITSPPYWDILMQKRTADYKAIRHYGDAERDLGKISDYGEFLEALAAVFRLVYQALKPNKYCVAVVMDIRKKDKFYPFHSDLARVSSQDVGFIFDDLIIWDRRAEYNNMRPLGYPSVFRINKAHEYLVIFKKGKT